MKKFLNKMRCFILWHICVGKKKEHYYKKYKEFDKLVDIKQYAKQHAKTSYFVIISKNVVEQKFRINRINNNRIAFRQQFIYIGFFNWF